MEIIDEEKFELVDRLEAIVERLEEKFLNIFKKISITFLALTALSIPVTQIINYKITPKQKTVVFTSGAFTGGKIFHPTLTYGFSKIIDFFFYSPITLRQNLEGNQVYWCSNATKEEVLENLSDEEYQNVVFIGHGDRRGYVATDKSVTVSDLQRKHIPKKEGMLIQHTCGGGDFPISLREILLKDPKKGYSFDKPITPFKNYGTALVKLFTGNLQMSSEKE